MQLTLWTYEGPPHVGAMRVATAMEGVHYVLHAPQGDTYADLLFTMIERLPKRPPVTYTSFQARDLGGDTAELFKTAARDAFERFKPQAMMVGASCTAELIQDDPGGLCKALDLPIPVVALELPSYQRKENWGASETFYQMVRALAGPNAPAPGVAKRERVAGQRPRCNLLGPTALGFRHRDDLREISELLARLGIDINVVAPLTAAPADLARLGDADFNVVLYPEIATLTATWLTRTFGQPATKTIPIGAAATRDFIHEVARLADIDPSDVLAKAASRAPWYSKSVDSTYLTGKRVFVFGDATHAVAAARVATQEFGFTVVGIGTYSREFAREVREAAKLYGVEPLISDDYLEIEARITELQPELVLGTQMERHIAKRVGVPCAVISAPVHVQDFPARYSPQMGFEGANVLFDTWVHPLMMGLEEHLIGMFRGDFEFHEDAAPSHLGGHAGGQAGSLAGAHVDARAGAHAGAHAAQADSADAVAQAQAQAQAAAAIAQAAQVDAVPGVAAIGTHGLDATPESIPWRPSAAVEVLKAAPAGALAQAREAAWAPDAEKELRKIPFFVRGKARRNTERYALEQGVPLITIETLYDAKAHFSR